MAQKKKLTQKKAPRARSVKAEIVDDKSTQGPLTESADVFRPSQEEIEHFSILNEGTSSSTALVPTTGQTTPSSSRDPLTLYLNEIRRYPVISKEEEARIAKKYYETKDPEAAQALVRSNLRFVVKIAAEYSKFGAKMIDLIQEGNVGLMHAVKEYNPYKGARIITYAVWWIRGYIQEYLMRQHSMVRIGTTQNQRKLFYQLQKEQQELERLGQKHDIALLSTRLNIPEDEVRTMAERMSGPDVSLDRPLDSQSDVTLKDLQRSHQEEPLDEVLATQEQIQLLKKRIEEIRPSLSEKEKIILDERWLNDEPLTLQEIGEKYGITREAVRQNEMRLMKKIREKMEG
jgi:RNA polymerase sigma-32 factor